MPRRTLLLFTILLLGLMVWPAAARTIGKGEYISRDWPPERLPSLPSFHVPQPGSLDEPWQFMQVLYDADTTRSGYQNYLNAAPVAMEFSHQGRGYLATLHTVFYTTNGGVSWRNLDPLPPPNTATSPYATLRSPVYLSGLSIRPVERTAATFDTLFLSAYNVNASTGFLRVIYYLQGPQLWTAPQLNVDYWLYGAAIIDSNRAFAVAGLDGRLYYNDSLFFPNSWEELNPNKVLIRSGRDDSLNFSETWIGSITHKQNVIAAVGSHQWISRDGGRWWRITASADTVFDNQISFADSLHAIVCGGMVSPESRGWVHYTTNGGRNWSGRTLSSWLPMRAVHMVTPQIGFAAGGNYRTGSGEIWRTTDGGASWLFEMQVNAEITAMASTRVSSAYVYVTAAGFFPDLRGGVWQKRLYMPDTTGALLIADPDTLDFGWQAPGVFDTLTAIVHNYGATADTVTSTSVQGGSNRFVSLWNMGLVIVEPDAEIAVPVLFYSSTEGEYSATVLVNNQQTGRVEIVCRATCGINAVEPTATPLPDAPALTVWPNPANVVFQIRYDVPVTGKVMLRIYDLRGRLVDTVVDGVRGAGQHTLSWDASHMASGIYFVQFGVGDDLPQTQKILLLK
ncbi:MAG: T9SS type A sorting domain-containing protein [Calditrichota bacterium]